MPSLIIVQSAMCCNERTVLLFTLVRGPLRDKTGLCTQAGLKNPVRPSLCTSESECSFERQHVSNVARLVSTLALSQICFDFSPGK